MQMSQVPVPDVYREESADFRFFQKWFELALSKVQYDTEEFFDLFDPLRCPEDLLWMLADTMGFKYDDRMIPAFNRLVLVYFMSMIRLKGSKDGVTLAAQVNLDQFKLQDYATKNHILNNRLEDTSIPSNAIYVQPHVAEGYIDVVYFSDTIPEDVCLEYTRPLGMYLAPRAGVRYDAKGMISVDARLTNTNDLGISIGSTHVGHYSIDDYSRMQRLTISDLDGDLHIRDAEGLDRDDRPGTPTPLSDQRERVWYRNQPYEDSHGIDYNLNPGYRALYSLQLANGSLNTRSMMRNAPSIDDLNAEDVSVYDPETGETHDNSYYESQSRSVRDPLAYVESQPMGTLGESMPVVELESSEDLQNSEDISEDK